MSEITLERQLKCARREVNQRLRVYPNLVLRGRMLQSEMDEELAAMQAIVSTLEHLRREELAREQPYLPGVR